MAYFGFTNKLRAGEKIQIFNYGNCKRDFTYVDDIVEGVVRVMQKAPDRVTGEDGLPLPPYVVYNIGNNQPENLLDFVQILSEELIRAGVLPEDYDFEVHKELVPMQPGEELEYTLVYVVDEDRLDNAFFHFYSEYGGWPVPEGGNEFVYVKVQQ